MGPGHVDFRVKKPRPVWERGQLDTDRSWPHFVAYRNTTDGVRTLDRARKNPSQDVKRRLTSQELPTLEQVHTWYVDQDWGARCLAYDQHMDDVLGEERDLLVKSAGAKLAASHLTKLQTAADIADLELDKLLATVKECDRETLKPAVLIRLLELVIRGQTLATGGVTERIEERVDVSHLSLDEARILSKAMRGKV